MRPICSQVGYGARFQLLVPTAVHGCRSFVLLQSTSAELAFERRSPFFASRLHRLAYGSSCLLDVEALRARCEERAVDDEQAQVKVVANLANKCIVDLPDKQRPPAARSRVSQADGASEGGCALRIAQLLERQERHDALPAVEDDLVGAAQDALHGFQIHALAGHLRRFLVLLVDL